MTSGMSRAQNDPGANQQKFEEVKAKQGGGAAGGPGIAGQWFSKIGGNFGGFPGFGGAVEKEEKNYTTCLTYMNSFQGKTVIMTGGTGGIGSKVAKKLLKAGNLSS